MLVYEDRSNPKLYMGVSVTEGEEFASLTVSTGTDGFETYYIDLRQGGVPEPGASWIALQRGFDHKTSIVDFVPATGKFLVTTEVDAPNYRLVEVDPAKPAKENWKDIIPHKEVLLQGVSTGGGWLFANYLKDVTTRIHKYRMDGSGEEEDRATRPGERGWLRGPAQRHLRLLLLHLVQ